MKSSDHSSRILTSVSGSAIQRDAMSWRPYLSSWKRCIDDFHLDPSQQIDVPVLQNSDWRIAREKLGEKTLGYAVEELEAVMLIASNAGYQAALADCDGVLLAEVAAIPEFRCDNERMGSVWQERFAGTNGVGTCLLEQRPVAVFREDHFFEEFVPQACVAAPFCDSNGELLGVINLTTRNPRILEETHRVIYHVTQQSAARLEKRFFLEDHTGDYIFSFHQPGIAGAFLAVNEDGYIVRANNAAKKYFQLYGESGSVSFWSLFEKDVLSGVSGLPIGHVQLRLLKDGTLSTARVRHPVRPITSWIQPARQKPSSSIALSSTRSPSSAPDLEAWAGQDTGMHKQLRLIKKVVGSGLPFLLLGETGVGKDTVAKAIHEHSNRRDMPYIAFNCAAVPESLIDSELFGYSKGAFTGANREGNKGRFLEANGGTLFLDEIGDMPLSLQTRLLRVLESGEVSPLGAGKAVKVDLQIIAATNQDVREKVERGEFRLDLYYRLAGLVVDVTPLREREDIDLLADNILKRLSAEQLSLSPDARHAIAMHDWPGNIRELKNVLHRAVHIAESSEITAEDLMLPAAQNVKFGTLPDLSESTPSSALEDAERSTLVQVLIRHSGNVDQAASSLGINKATLYRKIKRHNIDVKSLAR
ncbi:transcriptional regulator of acetoin/glycerol metabolism [Pseudomonas sp. WPR_5_2]|uniref:sigma-54-dependent Fis family transcriptional regulator n=1 Tax=Pseudomonas sp. WPR_5_2 TaxID=1907371 RepID=UPI000EAF67A2|nr:sigma-54-dependent Fis family transcriptional regulator [Pseudomonas sp. WPR_5_2]RKS18955.1 transcriptional regulator of acetoin/glycerol metabolism [Pseudomonas sp. WPR_5_2]